MYVCAQVVLAMRDLFQVVFELKKKEIELARQHIQSKAIHDHQPPLNIKNTSVESSHVSYSKTNNTEIILSSKYATAKEVRRYIATLIPIYGLAPVRCSLSRVAIVSAHVDVTRVGGRSSRPGTGIELHSARHHANGADNTKRTAQQEFHRGRPVRRLVHPIPGKLRCAVRVPNRPRLPPPESLIAHTCCTFPCSRRTICCRRPSPPSHGSPNSKSPTMRCTQRPPSSRAPSKRAPGPNLVQSKRTTG